LVVDDEVLVRLAVGEYLRDCGFHVFEAADGNEAIEVLQAAELPIDLVFSDVQMPGLDGFGLARWIRENRPEVRVLLTSGNPAGVAAKATELCHEGPVVAKPYDHAALLQRIKRMLARANEGG
jgi:CheY-like chemotaxis protein